MAMFLDNEIFQIVFQTFPGALPSPAQRDRLMRASRSECEACRVTGMMVRFGNSTVGVLEGHRETVLSHIELMLCDLEGSGLRVLREATISVRRFASWSASGLCDAGRLSERDEGEEFVGRTFADTLSRELYRNGLGTA